MFGEGSLSSHSSCEGVGRRGKHIEEGIPFGAHLDSPSELPPQKTVVIIQRT